MDVPGDFSEDERPVRESALRAAASIADTASASEDESRGLGDAGKRRRIADGGAVPGAGAPSGPAARRRTRRQREADRRVANRAHAKASRERAKAHLSGLEARVAELESSHTALMQRCAELERENAMLRGEAPVASRVATAAAAAAAGGGMGDGFGAVPPAAAVGAMPRPRVAAPAGAAAASAPDDDFTFEALEAGLHATLADMFGDTGSKFGVDDGARTSASAAPETATTTYVYSRKSAVLAIIIAYSISLLPWGETMRCSMTSRGSPPRYSTATSSDSERARRNVANLRALLRRALAALPVDLRAKVSVVLAAVRRVVKAEEAYWRVSRGFGGRFESSLDGRVAGNRQALHHVAPAC
mmetsp:Transcript_65030/g.157335  ORF Transcript_65030/g.157335 Transcript_65030/m.157335 type:complete len:359 (-) Transcript_65030:108-1184(-)